MPVKLGFIGAGRMAREHAKAAKALGASIVAVLSNGNPDNIAAFKSIAPEARFYDVRLGGLFDGGQMRGRFENDIDKVVIAVPWDHMTGYTMLACEALPMPVLLEKPIALTATSLDNVSILNHRILVGYNRRFYHTVDALRARVEEGGLKSVDATVSEIIDDVAGRHGAQIIPHLIEFNSHILDLILYLFAPLDVVYARRHQERNIPFQAIDALLQTSTGGPIHLHINANDPSPVGLRCRFEDGETWVLSPLETLTVYKGVEVSMDDSPPIRRYRGREIKHIYERSAFKPGVHAQMAAFLDGHYGPGCTIEKAMEVHDLIGKLKDWQ